MPKATYFNLPEEKREAIFEAALQEFSEHTFYDASVNRIIAKAGIPKGSFYQYFADKLDIYKHIADTIQMAKVEYITPAMQNPFENPFFSVLEEMYTSGIKFALENPQYAAFGEKLMAIKDSEVYNDLVGEASGTATDIYEQLIGLAVERGELRDDLDIPLTAHLLWKTSYNMVDYHLENVSADFDEGVMETSLKFFDFLKKGIEKQGGTND